MKTTGENHQSSGWYGQALSLFSPASGRHEERRLNQARFGHELGVESSFKFKRGFTLIELLVVIAIIALLLMIVTPSLILSREQARDIYCRNNLKQMCVAASAYAMSNDDYYPIAYYRRRVETTVAAMPSSAPHVSIITPPDEPPAETVTWMYCWDFTTITAGGRTETRSGILWQGDTLEKVQQCPSYKGVDNWDGNPYTGYNYNTSFIGHGQGESVNPTVYTGAVKSAADASGDPIVLPAKMSHVNNPASCVLFGDGHYAGGANKLMRSPRVWEGDTDWDVRIGGTQGFRHIGQTNIGWAAGHVTLQKDIYTDTHPKYKLQLDAYNRANKIKIGFLSLDNSLYDLK
jgi:prepilin-type N-terminal cleavage/methylation domain-containing protein